MIFYFHSVIFHITVISSSLFQTYPSTTNLCLDLTFTHHSSIHPSLIHSPINHPFIHSLLIHHSSMHSLIHALIIHLLIYHSTTHPASIHPSIQPSITRSPTIHLPHTSTFQYVSHLTLIITPSFNLSSIHPLTRSFSHPTT